MQIEEVNRYFEEEEVEEPELTDRLGVDTRLLFNAHPPATRQELLDMLPDRHVVDQLIVRYFTTNSPALRTCQPMSCLFYHLIPYRYPSPAYVPK